MKKTIIFVIVILALAAGCSSSNKPVASNERWDYKEGFVVAKENGRVLVVRDRVTNETPLSKILEEAQPNAIWLSVGQAQYDHVSAGDQISIDIPNGAVDESYPAQASADISKK
ncbi:DUF3221 domain-containing protein [Paenibacillus chibensis]|uniref:DUF3221 domain-containing protein n=1 Tax=Paenibacillus chibensis TaxID=59846 RepID=A0ABU6PX57_9BACL|nr:DUF3221 domain-containing protein [Paenibacillus chibensis]